MTILDPDQIAPKQSDLGLNFFFELWVLNTKKDTVSIYRLCAVRYGPALLSYAKVQFLLSLFYFFLSQWLSPLQKADFMI